MADHIFSTDYTWKRPPSYEPTAQESRDKRQKIQNIYELLNQRHPNYSIRRSVAIKVEELMRKNTISLEQAWNLIKDKIRLI